MKFTAILASLLILGSQAFAKEVYDIDTTHTFLMFRVGHLGFSHSYGRFTDVTGQVTLEDKVENSKIDITIKADSLTTQDEKRDKHLKSPDFFNTKQFPLITFKSKEVKKSGDTYHIKGDLTMKGVTKSVAFDFKRLGTGKDPWGNTRTGGDFSFKIKRSDFGINFMMGEKQVPDEVEVMASVEGILKK